MADTTPKPSFYDATGTSPVTEWNIGDIDAASESSIFKVTLWNNKGGSTTVSSMKRIKMFLCNPNGDTSCDLKWDAETNKLMVDQNGNYVPFYDGPVSGSNKGKKDWVYTRINYAGTDVGAGWGSINGEKYVDIYAAGVDPNTEGYMISGAANSGKVSTDVENYSLLECKLSVPLDAPAGPVHFKERVTYAYT